MPSAWDGPCCQSEMLHSLIPNLRVMISMKKNRAHCVYVFISSGCSSVRAQSRGKEEPSERPSHFWHLRHAYLEWHLWRRVGLRDRGIGYDHSNKICTMLVQDGVSKSGSDSARMTFILGLFSSVLEKIEL